MNIFNSIFAYFDAFSGKCDYLLDLRQSALVSEKELINANNQLLSDLINSHAKCDLLSQYVSLNSELFENKIVRLYGDIELIKEIIKVGSNLSDYFGYCGFCTDSTNICDGFSLVIDKNALAFSHNDVHAFSDLVSKNIRFRKAVCTATKFDQAYQLPTYTIDGVNFNIVPVQKIQYPFVQF